MWQHLMKKKFEKSQKILRARLEHTVAIGSREPSWILSMEMTWLKMDFNKLMYYFYPRVYVYLLFFVCLAWVWEKSISE